MNKKPTDPDNENAARNAVDERLRNVQQKRWNAQDNYLNQLVRQESERNKKERSPMRFLVSYALIFIVAIFAQMMLRATAEELPPAPTPEPVKLEADKHPDKGSSNDLHVQQNKAEKFDLFGYKDKIRLWERALEAAEQDQLGVVGLKFSTQMKLRGIYGAAFGVGGASGRYAAAATPTYWVRIDGTAKGSPAEIAGLHNGDELFSINGSVVKPESTDCFLSLIGEPGTSVELSIRRKGKILNVTVLRVRMSQFMNPTLRQKYIKSIKNTINWFRSQYSNSN